jgi:predicted metallo-beta-lactamase superfamily hydrolase
MRVRQIVKETVGEDPMAKVVKTRKVFAGINLDPALKEAVKRYAKESGMSMSECISRVVEEHLKAMGIAVIKEPVNRGEPLLPFEDLVV